MTIESVRHALDSIEAIKKLAAESASSPWLTAVEQKQALVARAIGLDPAVASYLELALALEELAKERDILKKELAAMRIRALGDLLNDLDEGKLYIEDFDPQLMARLRVGLGLAAKEHDGR